MYLRNSPAILPYGECLINSFLARAVTTEKKNTEESTSSCSFGGDFPVETY